MISRSCGWQVSVRISCKTHDLNSVTENKFQFIKFIGPASARSYEIGVVGNNWMVSNAVFSETALRIFLIFCMKLGDYKGRKVTEPYFWKEFLIWRYLWKSLQISPKPDTLIFFSKTALTIFWVFGLKLVLNMTFNLNETYFSEKFAIWTCLTSKSSKKWSKLRFLAIFSTLQFWCLMNQLFSQRSLSWMFDWVLNMALKIQKPLIEHIYECFKVTYLIWQNTVVLTQHWVKYVRIMVFAYTCFLV